jgi:hypothetical protein
MRALKRSGATAVLVGVLALACSPPPEPPPIRLTVGVHDVAFQVPEGWLHLDHGREHRFHRDSEQISLADVGPVTPRGYRREIEHARELFRAGQSADARAHLDSLDLRSAFSKERQWRDLEDSWDVILDRGRGRNARSEDVEQAYLAVLARIDTLAQPALTTLIERALPGLDHGAQRDVAEQHSITIDGRAGMRIETWDRLSHDHRKSYLFVLNEENLLVARMELGRYSALQTSFETLADSLEIHPRPAEGS